MVDHDDDACQCPDALAFRALVRALGGPPAAVLDRLVAEMAARQVSAASGAIASSMSWSRNWSPYRERTDSYDTPGRTAEQIRTQTAASWRDFERTHGYR